MKFPLIAKPLTLAQQVEKQIDARIAALCFAEYKRANFTREGKKVKTYSTFATTPQLDKLVQLKQKLAEGKTKPETIRAQMNSKDIKEALLAAAALRDLK